MTNIGNTNQSNTLPTFTTPSEYLPTLYRNQWLRRVLNVLQPLRQWLDDFEISDPEIARFLSSAIPAQCPFERDIVLFGRKIGHIPPLCKLNPFYEQLVGLRFRALCFLAEQGEDVQSYCSQ